jgi:hypothetical protein
VLGMLVWMTFPLRRGCWSRCLGRLVGMDQIGLSHRKFLPLRRILELVYGQEQTSCVVVYQRAVRFDLLTSRKYALNFVEVFPYTGGPLNEFLVHYTQE